MSKFSISNYNLVKINWQDAMDCETGWHDLKKLKLAKTEPVVSVGYVILDNEKQYTLVSDFCSDGTSGRAITIPKDWCQKVTKLNEVQNES
tara:strand:+ start:1391 stop:1663 length:273 start_codon:yes stop_codon:yes gene_type:complete